MKVRNHVVSLQTRQFYQEAGVRGSETEFSATALSVSEDQTPHPAPHHRLTHTHTHTKRKSTLSVNRLSSFYRQIKRSRPILHKPQTSLSAQSQEKFILSLCLDNSHSS